MKKFLLLLAIILFIPTPVHAATTIELTEPSHRQIDGTFIDDKLADLIAPDGRLGKLVFDVPRGAKVWNIDGALIDEISAMADGYKLAGGKAGVGTDSAKLWLNRLKSIASFEQVNAIAYGNPSGYWIHRLNPHNESFFLSASANHLSKFFGRTISPLDKYGSLNYFKLSSFQSQSYLDMRDAIENTAKYMDSADLEHIQLRSAALFNQNLSSSQRDVLAKDLVANTFNVFNKIRLAPGKFTISSRKQELPITIINDYPNSATLRLSILAMNGRLRTPNSLNIKLEGKSRTQVKIPVEVFTSGSSQIAVGIFNERKVQLGDYTIYPVTIRTISPIATWLTTTAAVVLFISALVQSLRRIRKRER